MPNCQPGQRVGAIESADKEVVRLYGYGVYDGDFPHDVWGMGVIVDNPRITLDGGGVVWGCQCWWGPEEVVREQIGGREVVAVPPPDQPEQ